MIKIIGHSDICSKIVSDTISMEMAQYNHVLYLTATSILRDIRLLDDAFSSLDNPISFLSIIDFENDIRKAVYSKKNCLASSDQKYILAKVLENYLEKDNAKYKAFYSIRNELYQLYNALDFNGVRISCENIDKIKSDFSETEATIFEIYRQYCAIIDKVLVNDIGNINLDIALVEENKTEINTFAVKQKECIDKRILECEALVLDGFLFFDDMQKYLLQTAIRFDKAVYIVSKQFYDGVGEFILSDALNGVLEPLGASYEHIKLCDEAYDAENALNLAKKAYPNIFVPAEQRRNITLSDGSIRFIAPFVNREEELRWVVKNISDDLRSKYDGTKESIVSSLSEIAVITAISKTKYEQRIDDLFADYGVFMRKESGFDNIDLSTVKEVYFTKQEFLSSDIRTLDGETLSFEDKLSLFKKDFQKIKVNKHNRPLNSYPIGQFVFRLYGMVSKGITVDAFKNILYSNWKYCVGETNIKWSKFLSDFKYVEHWFEKSNNLEEWMSILTDLVGKKKEIADNVLYKYHPLNAVKMDSLLFFRELVTELNGLLYQILIVHGGIAQHITVLKNAVMKADSFCDNKLEPDEEEIIIQRMFDAVSEISNSSMLSKVTPQFFAENIRAMMNDYISDVEEENNALTLAVVNLENIKQYSTCYFIMCEADNYPRPYISAFPYTDEICEILSNEKYGICALPSKKFGAAYHIELERYLLKNVLDFTRDRLIITHTEKEAGNNKGISIFAENIATMFDNDIEYESNSSGYDVLGRNAAEKERILLPAKDNYSLTDLATFKLCPRLYYHKVVDENTAYTSSVQLHFYLEAILFCDIMKRFMDYNTEHKCVYDVNDDSYIDVIRELHRNVLEENARYFTFFSQYEINDAGENVYDKIISSIENSKNYVKGNTFTLINYKDSVYRGNGYTVTIEHDNRFVDYDNKTWRMSQNSTYLEFLVLKTNDRKSELVHYADMMKALNENNSDEDRVNLVSRIIAKINIQFDSKRFAGDGIKRTDGLVAELLSYDFSNAEAMPSNYCNYCKLKSICMGN